MDLATWKAQASPEELARFEWHVDNISLGGYRERETAEEIVWGDADYITNRGHFLADHPILGRPDE